MSATKMSFAEFLDWLDVMTPEELRMVVEVGERKLAERRSMSTPNTPPQV